MAAAKSRDGLKPCRAACPSRASSRVPFASASSTVSGSDSDVMARASNRPETRRGLWPESGGGLWRRGRRPPVVSTTASCLAGSMGSTRHYSLRLQPSAASDARKSTTVRRGAHAVPRRCHLQGLPGGEWIRDPSAASRAAVANRRAPFRRPGGCACHRGWADEPALPPECIQVARRQVPPAPLAEGPTCRTGLRPAADPGGTPLHRGGAFCREVRWTTGCWWTAYDDSVGVDDHQARGQRDRGGLSLGPVRLSGCAAEAATRRGVKYSSPGPSTGPTLSWPAALSQGPASAASGTA